jgi:hypothetical protein
MQFRGELADFGGFYERTYQAAFRTAYGIMGEPAAAGLPMDQMASVSQSYITPDVDLLAEQAADCGHGCLVVEDPGRNSVFGQVDGPIDEVVTTDHIMAISGGGGFWIATTGGVRPLEVPKTIANP